MIPNEMRLIENMTILHGTIQDKTELDMSTNNTIRGISQLSETQNNEDVAKKPTLGRDQNPHEEVARQTKAI